MSRGFIRNERRLIFSMGGGPYRQQQGPPPEVALLSLAVFSPHVHLPHFYPRGVVDDAVHDGVGVDAAAEPGMPVLLLELRTEDRGSLLVSPLHHLEDEGAEALVELLEQPLVQHEQPEVRHLSHELGVAPEQQPTLDPPLLCLGASPHTERYRRSEPSAFLSRATYRYVRVAMWKTDYQDSRGQQDVHGRKGLLLYREENIRGQDQARGHAMPQAICREGGLQGAAGADGEKACGRDVPGDQAQAPRPPAARGRERAGGSGSRW